MDVINFLSKGVYIKLPPSSNPRVYLAVNSKRDVKFSFKLYNPFSCKANLLKSVMLFFYSHFYTLAKVLLPCINVRDSLFVSFLNKTLNTNITSSLYIASAKDKYVLQLTDNSGIVGYLKFPINDLGKERLINEEKAISILSSKGIIPKAVLKDSFYGTNFLILKNLEGSIEKITQEEYKTLLSLFKKEYKYRLENHPRIINLRNQLINYDLSQYSEKLSTIISRSSKEYFEVYEHGDFAPWNLMKTKIGIVPFDFEYFEEDGLEYLDEFKYHFQIERLLNNKNGKSIIKSISKVITIEEFTLFFNIFLFKEILTKKKEQSSYDFEISVLKILNNDET